MTKKILFIEDESALQRSVAERLASENYQVISALDGEEGITLAKKEKPDLVLLDLILPGKDGFAVLEELREDSATKNTPIVILSNLENSTDVEKALAAGAMSYLVKTNYQLDEVVEKIKKYIH